MQDSTQTADYISSMCCEFAGLAKKSKFHLLQYLLNLAALEAGQRAAEDATAHNRPSPLPIGEAGNYGRRRKALAA